MLYYISEDRLVFARLRIANKELYVKRLLLARFRIFGSERMPPPIVAAFGLPAKQLTRISLYIVFRWHFLYPKVVICARYLRATFTQKYNKRIHLHQIPKNKTNDNYFPKISAVLLSEVAFFTYSFQPEFVIGLSAISVRKFTNSVLSCLKSKLIFLPLPLKV